MRPIRWIVLALALAAWAMGAPKVRQVGPNAKYKTPCKAFADAGDGDTIEIDAAGGYKGDVCIIWKNRLTIRGVNGRPRIDAAGRSAEGKGTWVIKGAETVVQNIEFTGASVGEKNGAGIRQEGRGLRVENCYFHHNENGILAAPSAELVEVAHSEFGWNGHGDGYSHNIYVTGGAQFVLYGCYVHHANAGNLVKSRAAVNIIVYNRLSQEDGTGSWELDMPNGGQALVMGNVIQQGAESVNGHMIAFGNEGARPSSRMLFLHNTVVNTRPNAQFFLHPQGTRIEARNNLFAGKAAMGLNDPALPEGNVVDPEMRLVDPAAHNYAPAPGSPAINAARGQGEWEGKPVKPQWQYVRPGCVQARKSEGAMAAGAIEPGLNDSPAVCAPAAADAARKPAAK